MKAAAVVFMAGSLFGQFSGLTAPGDGSNVFFVSSLPLRGTGEPRQERVFEVGATPLRMVKSGAVHVTQSSDGKTRAYVYRDQNGYSQTVVEEQPKRRSRIFFGYGVLSSNGRYLQVAGNTAYLVDLTTMAYHNTMMAQRWVGMRRTVADTGEFIAGYMFSGGHDIPGGVSQDATLDAAGRTIVDTWDGKLRRIDTASGVEAVLVASGDPEAPAISADEATIAFLSAGQVEVMRVDGSGRHQVTHEPSGIREFNLSDDGRVVWCASNAGTLSKVEVASGGVSEYIGRTAEIDYANFVSPGSAFTILGTGFGNRPQVSFDLMPAPILSASETELVVQAPWELPVGRTVNLVIDNGAPSPFEKPSVQVESGNRAQVDSIIHQDWSGKVADQSPARPGEIVHAYVTGLGAVTPAVKTGIPGPFDPPSVLVEPLQCNAKIVYAGLAPGLVGYYQVSFEIPSAERWVPFWLECPGRLLLQVPIAALRSTLSPDGLRRAGVGGR